MLHQQESTRVIQYERQTIIAAHFCLIIFSHHLSYSGSSGADKLASPQLVTNCQPVANW